MATTQQEAFRALQLDVVALAERIFILEARYDPPPPSAPIQKTVDEKGKKSTLRDNDTANKNWPYKTGVSDE